MTIGLPTYHTPFIGRQYHLHALSAIFRDEHRRLVTVLGPGGIGKTRLSVRLGELLIDFFEEGVYFIPLDVVTNADQVPLYIGHRFGLSPSTDLSWTEQIIREIANRRLFLILDNLEQVLPATETIDQIMTACPNLQVLVTSREILGLPYEVEYPLDSLNRPNPRLFPSPVDLLKFDAIRLFVQKAQLSQPNFELTEENAAAVVGICQELDGLPLPIELAAARIKLFSPNLILQKIKDSTDLLRTRSRSVIYRHQNIRNTIQWSYDLLDEQERQLFFQISLFRSGFTPKALEAVCTDHDPIEVIESFLNKSLIVKDKEIEHQPRFRMLKLIRDFGLEQLEEYPDSERYYRKFSHYFTHYLETIGNAYHQSQPTRWIARVEADYENINVALEWLMANDCSTAAILGSHFWKYYLSRGLLREGIEMVRQLLALPFADSPTRAHLLEGAGTLSHNLGHHLEARDHLEQCMDLWKALQEQTEIMKTLNNLAWAEWRIGQYDQCVQYSQQALKIALTLNDQQAQAKARNNLAWVAFFRGKYEEAVEIQQEVLELCRKTRQLRGIAFAKTNLAWALSRLGAFSQAESLIVESIALFEELQDPQLSTFSHFVKANLLIAAGKPDAAGNILSQICLPNFSKIGDAWGLAHTCCQLGEMSLRQQKMEEARSFFSRALKMFQDSHDKIGAAHVSLQLGRQLRMQGRTDRAKVALTQCVSIAANARAYELLKNCFFELGILAIREKTPTPALPYFAVADYYAEQQGDFSYRQWHTTLTSSLAPDSEKISLEFNRVIQHKYPGIGDFLKPQLKVDIHEFQIPERVIRLNAVLDANAPADEVTNKVADPRTDPFLNKVYQLVELHLADSDLSVDTLSNALHLSASQLHRKLKAKTGHSTGKFIRHLRLQKALEMLQDPDLTITAIAYDTGFRDINYFYRVFKQTFGFTPGEYRKSLP